jgi:hypothetical protein
MTSMTNLMTLLMLAVSGKALIDLFIMLIVVGLICWILWWLIGYIGLPEPFNKIARALIAIVAAIFLINALLGLIGKSFISW